MSKPEDNNTETESKDELPVWKPGTAAKPAEETKPADINFNLEAWLKSTVQFVFWLLLALPLVVFPIIFLTIVPAFEFFNIRLGATDAFAAANVFLVAILDPLKAIPIANELITEAAIPLGLPPQIIIVTFLLLFLWENENDSVFFSRYPGIKQFKEVLVGTREQAGIWLLIPRVRDMRVNTLLWFFIIIFATLPLQLFYGLIFIQEFSVIIELYSQLLP